MISEKNTVQHSGNISIFNAVRHKFFHFCFFGEDLHGRLLVEHGYDTNSSHVPCKLKKSAYGLKGYFQFNETAPIGVTSWFQITK